jgi:hypothetical protein
VTAVVVTFVCWFTADAVTPGSAPLLVDLRLRHQPHRLVDDRFGIERGQNLRHLRVQLEGRSREDRVYIGSHALDSRISRPAVAADGDRDDAQLLDPQRVRQRNERKPVQRREQLFVRRCTADAREREKRDDRCRRVLLGKCTALPLVGGYGFERDARGKAKEPILAAEMRPRRGHRFRVVARPVELLERAADRAILRPA